MINEPLEQLIIRPYKPKDAEAIVSWIKDERDLRKWSSDRYGAYPITAEDINYKYLKGNGDCEERIILSHNSCGCKWSGWSSDTALYE